MSSEILKSMPVDLDFVRSIYDVHNEVGVDFPDIFARLYLHADAEWVETPAAPGATTHRGSDAVAALFRDRLEAGAMRIDDLMLTALDDHRVLAAFLIRIRGTGSGAEASMRLWNLLTFDGSRITRIEEFSEEAAALAAARR